MGDTGQPWGGGGGVGTRGEGGRTAGEGGRTGGTGAAGDGGRVGEGGRGAAGEGRRGEGVGPAVTQLMGQLVPPEHELLPVHMHWQVVA